MNSKLLLKLLICIFPTQTFSSISLSVILDLHIYDGMDLNSKYHSYFVVNVFVAAQVKKNYEALRQREEEERMVHSSPPKGREDPQTVSKWEKESHEATRELLKVKDRLIEVERNVS